MPTLNTALAVLVANQRSSYHQGLLAWYRDPEPEPGLQQLGEVLQRLAAATQIAPLPQVYAVAAALTDALHQHPLAKRDAVKLTFGHLERTLKQLLDEGETATAEQLSTTLSNQQRNYLALIIPDHPLLVSTTQSCDECNEHSTPQVSATIKPVSSEPFQVPTPPDLKYTTNRPDAKQAAAPTNPENPYRNTPFPAQAQYPATERSAYTDVNFSHAELDWMLDQIETLNNQQGSGDRLQAALLAKRLTPIQQVIEQLQQRINIIANPYDKHVRLSVYTSESVLQTDQIRPLVRALKPQLSTAIRQAEHLHLYLQRDNTQVNVQLEANDQSIGELIQLPYRYALGHALLIEHQDQTYAVADASLEKVVRVANDECHLETAVPYITHTEHDYLIRDLGCLLNGQSSITVPSYPEKITLLLVSTVTDVRYAIPVNSIIGHYQLLIKPIGKPLNCIPWFTGGSCLPQGKVALHLQLDKLVAMSRFPCSSPSQPVSSTPK